MVGIWVSNHKHARDVKKKKPTSEALNVIFQEKDPFNLRLLEALYIRR